jgi:general secretion pathway protein G
LDVPLAPRYMQPAKCEAVLQSMVFPFIRGLFDPVRFTSRATRRKSERGFTLVELLVVLAILGLLIALVAPALIHQLGSAKHKVAQQSIERLSGILDLYRLDVGNYPTTAQGLDALSENAGNVTGWNGPYIKDAGGIIDPWGRPFQYRSPSDRPGHDFDIVTLGADGKQGGEGEDADIINR